MPRTTGSQSGWRRSQTIAYPHSLRWPLAVFPFARTGQIVGLSIISADDAPEAVGSPSDHNYC